MRIGILGAGHMGATLARLLLAAGHEVAVSNSRGPETLRALTAELGERSIALTAAEAAAFGEVVMVAIPFGRFRELPAEALASKIVVDANNYYPDRDGHFAELDEGLIGSSELIQGHLAGARVVKALNTQYAHKLRSSGRPRGSADRVAVPIAGDDQDAKTIVAQLIDQIGYDVVDLGALSEGRRMEPGSPVYTLSVTRQEIEARLAA